MRGPFRLTTALYPAMGVVLVLSAGFSSRQIEAGEMFRDQVFPMIHCTHPPGSGTFFPGSFALNFFVPSLILMGVLNLLFSSRFGVIPSQANLFYYLLGLVIAIVEVGADTLLPLIALPARWGLSAAVSAVHGFFVLALALAGVASRGAEREW